MRQKLSVKGRPPSGPLHVRVELGGRVYEDDLEAWVRADTDPTGLNRALAEQPGRFAWWAVLEAKAQGQAEQAENHRATKHAELYGHYEAALVRHEDGERRTKPTVEAVKAAIQKHPDYQRALAALAAANEQAGVLLAARQAMQERRECLIELARNMREERQAHLQDHLREARERFQAGRQ